MCVQVSWVVDVPDPIDLEVGARLRAIRRRKGMNQAALGQALGLTFQQVQKYETGANRISASMLVRCARVLEIHPREILCPGEPADPSPPHDLIGLLTQTKGLEELISNYARIPAPHRRAFLMLARSLSLPTGTDDEQAS